MSTHELILGGQRSGKSRHAERLGLRWLNAAPAHAPRRVVVLATARALDAEMRARIKHHQAQRPSGFATREEPLALAQALREVDDAQTLVIVDCLTLWLTNWLMPLAGAPDQNGWQAERAALLRTLPHLKARVLLISNEIGWGVSPMSAQARHYVDELGRLHQDLARCCASLTLMVAGQPWSRPVQELNDD